MKKIKERLIMIFLNPPLVRHFESFHCDHCEKTCMLFHVEEREEKFHGTRYKASPESSENIFCPFCGKK